MPFVHEESPDGYGACIGSIDAQGAVEILDDLT
jgi:hypothetical protein